MRFPAVVFDLDGTLLDTLDDIANAANAALTLVGYPPHPIDSYRQFIGNGVAVLFQRALPEGASNGAVTRCVGAFEGTYGGSWNDRTRTYDGVAELLDELTARGVVLTLLSNKPDGFTDLCAREYLSRWPFQVVLGARDGVPKKPDPAAAIELAERVGLDPYSFAYLGDTAVDMGTARRAGMYPVGASWGFRPVEELVASGAGVVIDHPSEFLKVVLGQLP